MPGTAARSLLLQRAYAVLLALEAGGAQLGLVFGLVGVVGVENFGQGGKDLLDLGAQAVLGMLHGGFAWAKAGCPVPLPNPAQRQRYGRPLEATCRSCIRTCIGTGIKQGQQGRPTGFQNVFGPTEKGRVWVVMGGRN